MCSQMMREACLPLRRWAGWGDRVYTAGSSFAMSSAEMRPYAPCGLEGSVTSPATRSTPPPDFCAATTAARRLPEPAIAERGGPLFLLPFRSRAPENTQERRTPRAENAQSTDIRTFSK